ncbi:MAG: SEC-C metal-binding domain-containing protein, partial [Acidimicrobiales bacterium]
WQRDGYEMFGQLMSSIDDDYVKIVMHAQVVVGPLPGGDAPGLANATYQAPGDPVQGALGIERAAMAGPAPGEEIQLASDDDVARARSAPPTAAAADGTWDHVGRNDPCPCRSGKKFKFCHGR